MSLIELSFRNENVFMTKNNITDLTNEEWFLHILTFKMSIIYFVIRLFLLGYLPTFIIPI